MSKARDFLDELSAAFEETPETRAHEWRLDLATLIGRGLDRQDWTQKRLSEKSGIPPAIISRLVNAGQNCTIESAVRALFALNVHARIVESDVATHEVSDMESVQVIKFKPDTTNGQESSQTRWYTQKETSSTQSTAIAGG